MRLLRVILMWAILVGTPVAGWCREEAQQTPPPAPVKEEPGLSAYAVPLWNPELPGIGHFPITNSMLVAWIVAVVVIIFAQIATRNMKAVPEGAQNFWEWMVEGLYDFLSSILGPDLVKQTFWFFITIFIFILFTN